MTKNHELTKVETTKIELAINREPKQYGSALCNQWRLPLLHVGFTEPMKFAVTKPCHIPQC